MTTLTTTWQRSDVDCRCGRRRDECYRYLAMVVVDLSAVFSAVGGEGDEEEATTVRLAGWRGGREVGGGRMLGFGGLGERKKKMNN